MFETVFTRREAIRLALAGTLGLAASPACLARQVGEKKPGFQYALASSLFGDLPLADILAVTKSCGADFIDLWTRVHGTQREQVEEMGEKKFSDLLDQYDIRLGLTTRFDLGPFKLKDELRFVSRFGGKFVVTGAPGPKHLKDDALRTALDGFCERLEPHIAEAENAKVSIALENHSGTLLHSFEAIRYFCDKIRSPCLKLALAPSHLPQNPRDLADLIKFCGNRIGVFYAWQYGKGFSGKLPREDELQQLPGRGPLDFQPLLRALKEIDFQGFVEIFMHPFPRGIPILPTLEESAEEIKRAYHVLEQA